MNALLVIDAQNTLLQSGDFRKEVSVIRKMVNDFKSSGSPVIVMRHVSEEEHHSFYREEAGSQLPPALQESADYIIEKRTPSAFFQTSLDQLLQTLDIKHVFITGFNIEYCCLFTAVAAFDRGYEVTLIEDATSTINTDETYEMPGLDIRNFISSILNRSDVIEVVEYEKYLTAQMAR